ncbi:MAG: hypothetical protein NTW28_26390 [Candidatus Solibacter sp.]|nr:hypothetical protein [Candidatus Solibacter sp.]
MAATLDDLRTSHEGVLAKLQQLGSAVPPTIQDWLGRLALLYGVPFENLVPDVRMLPKESLRFFYLDMNWVESLVDGAFSTGVHSGRDIRFHDVLQSAIRDATRAASGELRSNLRGDTPPGESAVNATRCGLLLRSEAVSGWPGLEVRALVELVGEDTVPLLRMDRPAPDTVLCIFAGIPKRVEIWEPTEDLHFGITRNNDGSLAVLLRNPETGARLDPSVPTPLLFRNQAKGTLNMAALATSLARSAPAPAGGRAFGPGDFGVQMIDAADKEVFTT